LEKEELRSQVIAAFRKAIHDLSSAYPNFVELDKHFCENNDHLSTEVLILMTENFDKIDNKFKSALNNDV
jgi:hypothetical protein